MYANGQGAPQNYYKAVELFTKACDKDFVSACNNLGLAYANGTGCKAKP